MEVARNSDGVFDITCAPLVNLWGFGFNKKDSVTPAMIDSLKTFCWLPESTSGGQEDRER